MAAERNITIYQGDTYLHDVTLNSSSNTAIDITDRSYSAQIRPFRGSTTLVATFTTEIVSASEGKMRFSLTPEQTANLDIGTYIYDLQQIDSGVVLTLMAGTVTVIGQVSS